MMMLFLQSLASTIIQCLYKCNCCCCRCVINHELRLVVRYTIVYEGPDNCAVYVYIIYA